MTNFLSVLRSVSLAGLCALTCLAGCTVPQQQQVIDRTIGRVFGKGQTVSQSQSVQPTPAVAARPAPPAATAPVGAPPAAQSAQIFLLWQKTMTAHPQLYLECLQDAQCGPALKSYVGRLQHQTGRRLELPSAYQGYGLGPALVSDSE